MKITVLTSSRADFGIQLPLLRALQDSNELRPVIVAFGSHADTRLGNTIQEVHAAGIEVAGTLPPVLEHDDPSGIASAMASTMEQFARFWQAHTTDMVVALGDRYEMFSAVAASLPFGIPIAHLHGGETTLGAIDNAFRHSITHMSTLHFTCAEVYRKRVVQLTGSEQGVHNTGALSMDNLRTMQFLTIAEINDRFGVDLSIPTALITVHPETRSIDHADAQWEQLREALQQMAQRYQLLITLPNADTHGFALRQRWGHFLRETPNAVEKDSLGALGYLSCMQHCAFVLGNSSSGYTEASYFPKSVVDIGERQSGRIVTQNICRVPFKAAAIMEAVEMIECERPSPSRSSVYGDGHAAQRIVEILKNHLIR